MHIVFDYQIFSLQQYGGISRYFLELAHKLPVFCRDMDTAIVAPYHISPLLENSHRSGEIKVTGKKVPSFPGKHHILPVLNRFASLSILEKKKPDIIHETYYTDRPVVYDCPRILTVYDMIHERFCEYFAGVDLHVPRLKKRAISRVDHVIAISNSTRNDLIELLDIVPEKISVVPLASSLEKPSAETKKEIIRKRPYLLYVGLRNGVKNFNALLQTYIHSQKLKRNFDLICVGGGEFSTEERNSIGNEGLTENVLQMDADDKYLASLYSDAAVFVYPSLYEGFGMPILEAMRCGCPVVCSNTSSMPEIAGDAALFFNPHDEEELGSVLESVVNSEGLAARMRQRGYDQAAKFSWEQCINQSAEVYRLHE